MLCETCALGANLKLRVWLRTSGNKCQVESCVGTGRGDAYRPGTGWWSHSCQSHSRWSLPVGDRSAHFERVEPSSDGLMPFIVGSEGGDGGV